MVELLYDWRFTANQFISAASPLRITTRDSFFQLNTCGYSTYITFSLTRRWVCRFQLLLALVSAVIFGFGSRRTHDSILLSQIRDSPTRRARSPCLCPQEQGGPVINPGWVAPIVFLITTLHGPSRKHRFQQ
jgi:hypothetical protein